MSTHVAHFIITGEAMTEMARNLLLDDEPGKAYRLLADGLVGDGAGEAALSVLKGTHDLAGDSQVGLELVKAKNSPALRRFKKTFRYIYAGRHRSAYGWRRPVAKIVQFMPADGRWATEQVDGHVGSSATPGGWKTLQTWWEYRARFYCSMNETPELLKVREGDNAWIIWEPCNELPHWMKPPNALQEAFDEALKAGRHLEERPSQMEIEDAQQEAKAKAKAKTKRASKKQAHDRQREDEDDRRAQEHARQLHDIGERVRTQAGGDTFVLALRDGRQLVVPRAPFVRWALHRTAQQVAAPEWTTVAPMGVKMTMDNPDHTDWVLGAGLTLQEAYSDIVNEAAWAAASTFQEEAREAVKAPQYPTIMAALQMLRNTIHEAATVVDAGERTGTIGEDIAVFPDSDASRVDHLHQSTGVIVEKGGALAHFAIVSKGRGITIMRHPKACELFRPDVRVNLNPVTGRIVILDEDD